jgi:trimethylamine:corrinoid methyltransferase-like protein
MSINMQPRSRRGSFSHDRGFKSQYVPTYKLLTPEQIGRFHTATLELLETAGVDVHHEEARQLMAAAGCRLAGAHRVHIPNRLVEDAIQSAPSRIILYDRLGHEAMRLEGRRVYFGLGTDLVKTYDLDDTHIGLDVIQEVCPGGEFLSSEQTVEMFESEHWLPNLCNRDNLDTWRMKGGKDWAEACTEKPREILKTRTPEPLSEAVADTISEIRREAAAKLKDHPFRT